MGLERAHARTICHLRYRPFPRKSANSGGPSGPFPGAIAQLGERLHGMQEVAGSIPAGSTTCIQEPKPCRTPHGRSQNPIARAKLNRTILTVVMQRHVLLALSRAKGRPI